MCLLTKRPYRGSLGGAAVWRLPLAQGAILEIRDRIPRQAPGAWNPLLPVSLQEVRKEAQPGTACEAEWAGNERL